MLNPYHVLKPVEVGFILMFSRCLRLMESGYLLIVLIKSVNRVLNNAAEHHQVENLHC